MPKEWGITYGQRSDFRKGFPTQYLIGVISKPRGITVKLTRYQDKAQKFPKKPQKFIDFLEVWKQCKYPGTKARFRPVKL